MFSDSIAALVRRFLPVACALCAGRAGESGLCAGCFASLPQLQAPQCPVCAVPTPEDRLCGRCLSEPPSFDRVVTALEYGHPVDGLVSALKYRRQLFAARPLAYCLAQRLEQEPYPDRVLAMPVSHAHLRARGFNQAMEIARLACREFGLRPDTGLATRLPIGAPQASLPWKERRKNVRGAFRCEQDLSGLAVAVVDDVLTTGATLDELARVLKRRGARSVVGWICARTPASH